MRGLVVTLGALALVVVGCEEPGTSEQSGATTAPSSPPAPMIKRIATTFEIDQYATTRPTTTRAVEPIRSTTLPATTQSVSANLTPEETVDHMFRLMKDNKVAEVRLMLVDAPSPDILAAAVAQNHDELTNGGKWQVLEANTQGVAATVIYRTTFANGTEDVSPITLLRRYDRWKVLLGDYSARRYTDAEKSNLVPMMEWGTKRTMEIRKIEANRPASKPAAP